MFLGDIVFIVTLKDVDDIIRQFRLDITKYTFSNRVVDK